MRIPARILFAVLSIVSAVTAHAYSWRDPDTGYAWTYQINGNTAEISSGKFNVAAVSPKPTGSLAIPSQFGDKKVTSIGESAFFDCSGLTSVAIPDSVTRIDSSAFSWCSGLISFVVDGNNPSYKSENGLILSKDGKCLVCGINGSVTIPDSVTSIVAAAFCSCAGLTSVTIPDSVTDIGMCAFQYCSGLTSVTIPDSVTNIGICAFSGCSGLTGALTIPSSLTSISESVFSGCSGLASVTIPGSVMSIGENAFEDCSGLTSVTIPDSVTNIGNEAFFCCSGLTSVTIPDGVTTIGDCAFSGCRGLTSVTIPNSVTSIGFWAFNVFDGLTSVTIPQYVIDRQISNVFPSSYYSITNIFCSSTVTNIGCYAFSGCSGLKSVTIPDSVTSIGVSAFSGCGGLTSVAIPNGVISIGNNAFYGCSALTRVTIPDSVTSIGNNAFYGCSALTRVTIPDSVTNIGDAAFSDCSGLTGALVIPSGATSIGQSAFSGCSGLTRVTIPDSVTNIGDAAFSGCSGLEEITLPFVGSERGGSTGGFGYIFGPSSYSGGIATASSHYGYYYYIPANLKKVVITDETVIGAASFYGCSGLTSVTIPDSVTVIEAYAFQNCSGLTSVTIPDSVTSIEWYAFSGCSGLKGVLTIPSSVTSISESVFSGCCGLTSVTIPDSVTCIGAYAFAGCSELTSVTIPDSVTNIGNDAFTGCSGLISIVVDGNNPIYKSENGLLLSKDGKWLIHGINGNVTIPDSVTSIEHDAFSGCCGLTSVTIPDSVTNIGVRAFESCSGIMDVKVSQYVLDMQIKNVFSSSYSSITNVSCSSLITNIGYYAFSGCSGLKSVTIPDGVTSIGVSAFSGCSGLTSVAIPDSVTSIEDGAFYGCCGLTSVTIPDSVTSIGGSAFSRCRALEEISLPFVGSQRGNAGSSDSLFGYIFGGSSYSGGTVTRQYYSNGSNYGDFCIPSNLKAVVITDETLLGYGAFYCCTGLTSVTIGSGVTNIGNHAFHECGGLTSVTIPDSVMGIGAVAFYCCSGLTSVTIPDSVTSIGNAAFLGCSGLMSAAIPQSGVDSFRQAFGGYGSLSVVLSGAVTKIGDSAFNSCSGLTSVTIPDSVTNIGDLAFGYCSDLTQIIFEGDAPDIGSRAFERVDCTVTVNPWTRGWELAPNATWNGFALKYSTPVVFFDANGGVDVDDPVITDCGAFTNALPSADRTGYTFADWWTDRNGGSRIDGSTIIADSCTLYGHWIINKYHVVFNANGGEGGTSGELDYNSEIVAPTVTRTGYTFAGWSPDVLERVPAEDVTFTAQWTVNKYRVVFDANGGDGGANEQIEYATAIVAPIVTRTGYTFLGWDKDVATTVPAEDVTYVAQWKANTYKVSFDANGGEGEWTQRTLAYDSAYGELPVPSRRKHYEFIGWFTEAEGGVQIAADSVYSTAGDITLYAHWRCVWEYEENEYGTLTLTAIDPLPEGAVEIPAELEGHAVTALGKGLFNGAENIRQAMIPLTIESLGDWDLRDIEVAGSCDQDGFTIWNGWVLGYDDDTVSYLEVPEGIVGIAPYALSELWDLEEVVLSESLKYIGYRAFCDDGYLGNRGELVIPDGVEVIEDEAFKDCSWLPGIQIGGGVRKIGARAFEGNSSLTTLRMPDAVEEIGDEAFLDCYKLRSVKLPALLEAIGADPFAGCGALTGVTVPVWHWTMAEMFPSRYSSIANVTLLGGEGEIATNAFKGCSSLASVTIPVDVTNICDGAFMNCSNITAIELPENLVTVGADAFRGCSRLSAIMLPDSVTSIGTNVFYGCGSLANVTLSRSIVEIPDYAFYNCNNLKSIVMPEGVATLGNYISTSLSAVYLLCGKAPEYGENVYSKMPSSAKTYVKQGSRGWDGRPSSRVLPESWNGHGIEYWTPVQFAATFDANGGTFELTAETSGATQYACLQTKDTSYALPPFDPVWEGHVFDGWWTERSDGTRITATTRVIEEREITFYAHWIGDPKEVIVRFNANGGTVEPDECSYYSTRPYGTLPVPTREYYRFSGWWTLPQGGTRAVVSTEVPAADQELYAHWSPETYVIRYHANGGNGSMSDQPFVYGRTVTLRRNTFYRTDGQAFIGWAIEPDGAVVYTNEKTLSQIGAIQDGVINLYAVWASLRYAVRFDSNGGYGEMANQTFTIGEAQNITSNAFTRMGFGFIGWTTMPSGDVVYTDGQEVVDLTTRPNATVVLYAVWRLVSPMPEVANDSDVSVVMEDAADSLKANVTSLAEYTAYRAWAENTMESEEAAKTSDKAWLSFALGADALIDKELTSDDVKIESFAPAPTDGKFDFTVSVKDVNIGGGSIAEAVLKENLKKVLGVEGAKSLSSGAFSSDNIDITFGSPVNGKAKFFVLPPADAGNSFFMRVKVK